MSTLQEYYVHSIAHTTNDEARIASRGRERQRKLQLLSMIPYKISFQYRGRTRRR